MKKFAVFASGYGSNLEAILRAKAVGEIEGECVFVFSDRKDAYALQRAQAHGVKAVTFSPKDFDSRPSYETALLKTCQDAQIEWIFLAGYMRILTSTMLSAYPFRIVNVHPALLPAFKGAHGIRDAFHYGVKVTGVTIHFLEEEVDAGAIIAQSVVPVADDDTLESLEEKIHHAEHKIYPKVIAQLLSGEVVVKDRQIVIDSKN